MRKLLLLPLAVTALFTSCGLNGKSALKFNDKLATCSDSLFTKGKRMGNVIGTSMQTQDFTTLAGLNKDLQTYIDAQIKEITDLENVGGSEKLKTSMLQFLQFEKELTTKGVEPLTLMDKNTPPDQIQQALRTLMSKSAEENQYLDRVKTAQKEYAQKNGFVIKESSAR